jgi:hypothetical protein
MTNKEPFAIDAPITIWGMTRSKNPRRRCSVCKKPLNSARVDRGRVKKEKKVGRPRKGGKRTRYTKIGDFCFPCGIFYYLNRSPNYKMRLKSK